jgi:hypothetical protein
MQPTAQAGHRPAAPGLSAAEVYHWPQVGQHPQAACATRPPVSPYHLTADSRALLQRVGAEIRAEIALRRAVRQAREAVSQLQRSRGAA